VGMYFGQLPTRDGYDFFGDVVLRRRYEANHLPCIQDSTGVYEL
jgi:hypothetical protein